MQYWFNKSISDILYVYDTVIIEGNRLTIESKKMRKIYVALEMLHKFNLQLPYESQNILTEFITIANDLANRFSPKRNGIFSPMYYVGHINNFDSILKKMWEINNKYFV